LYDGAKAAFLSFFIPQSMKNKNVAGALAIFFGIFGTHRFYLGQRFLGALYFFLFWAGLAITIEEQNPIVMLLPALISLVDSIVFFAMPWEDFDRRYNKAYFKQNQQQQETPRMIPVAATPLPVQHVSKFDKHKKDGIRKFRANQYAAAIADFLEALRVRENDPAMAFNLACCYSMLGQHVPGFYYLEMALNNGFDDEQKIFTHQALLNLRLQPEFETFAQRVQAPPAQAQPTPPAEPTAAEEFLDLNIQESVEIPEPLLKLEDLKNRGILTEEEFELQKQKMLGYR
jgi:hypothetical protein